MAELLDYLSRVVQDGASDLFIIAGSPVCEKLESRLCHISPERVMPDDCERLITDLYEKAGRKMDAFLQRGDDDFSFSLPGLEEENDGAMRLWPQRHGTDGFYVCKMRKR